MADARQERRLRQAGGLGALLGQAQCLGLALDGDARNNTFMINAAIGPWPMQAFPTVRKLLKCRPDNGKRPRRIPEVRNHTLFRMWHNTRLCRKNISSIMNFG